MTKEKFMEFVNSDKMATDDGYYCKVVQHGVTYILFGDVSEGNLLSDYNNKMKVAGFSYNGKFYGVDFLHRGYDLDFNAVIAAFEKKFNEAYKAAENCFSLDAPAPITEVTQKTIDKSYRRCTEEDFEYYKENTAIEHAKRDIFGIVVKNYGDDSTHKEKFTPIFFDCLKHPEKFNVYVQTAIEENADIINYRLKCKAEMKKKSEELKQDRALMRTVAIYKALETIEAKTVKMTCELYGETFELSIEREKLMRELAYNTYIDLWSFTKTVQKTIEDAAEKTGVKRYNAKINFADIVKITYGKKIVYSEEQTL